MIQLPATPIDALEAREMMTDDAFALVSNRGNQRLAQALVDAIAALDRALARHND